MRTFTFLLTIALPALAVLSADGAESATFREITFFSHALDRQKTFSAVVPPGTDAGTDRAVLYLLHGRGRNHRSLLDNARSRALLAQAPCLVVLPDGEDGWYINSPEVPADRYADYLEEVIAQAEKQLGATRNPARRAIAGWSMGGFGAVSFAEAHPGHFGMVATIIGLLDFPRAEDLPAGQNYHVPVARFGSDPAVWRRFNPSDHVEQLRSARILVVTATESFDRTMNHNFVRAARAAGLAPQFDELPGGHTLDVVIAALPEVLRFVASGLAAPPPSPPATP